MGLGEFMRTRFGTCLLLVAAAVPAWTQDRAKKAKVQFQGSLRTRLEAWDWFGTSDPYALSGSILRFSLSQQFERLDWQLEMAAPVLLNLPAGAVQPAPAGLLGMGGNYYSANQSHRNAAMLFPKQAFVRLKGWNGHLVRLGRFEFSDGSELTPKNATLGALKVSRINQRLIGPFGFTHVGRSFDGFHYTASKPGGTLTFIGAVPTRGVFQVDGWGWNSSAFGYFSFAKATGTAKSSGDLRLFGIYYHDWRQGVLKTDNRPVALRRADMANIGIYTWGGHYVHAVETICGTADVLLWGAVQHGRWGRLDHRAGAAAFEAGIQPKVLPRLKPWIRGGYDYGSGDGNASDSTHSTFFQILPTPRPFARFPFFNMMNNRDAFASLVLRPHKAVSISTEAHALRLSSRDDLWLLGGGVFQPWSFGYIGRPSGGGRSLANLYDTGVDWKINAKWNLGGYAGVAPGRAVVASIYPRSRTAKLAYLELGVKF